jgi:hypothetical protein
MRAPPLSLRRGPTAAPARLLVLSARSLAAAVRRRAQERRRRLLEDALLRFDERGRPAAPYDPASSMDFGRFRPPPG